MKAFVKILVLLLFSLVYFDSVLAENWLKRDNLGQAFSYRKKPQLEGRVDGRGRRALGNSPKVYSRYFRANRERVSIGHFSPDDDRQGVQPQVKHGYHYGAGLHKRGKERIFREKRWGAPVIFRGRVATNVGRPEPSSGTRAYAPGERERYLLTDRSYERAEQGFTRDRYGQFSGQFGLNIGRTPHFNFRLGWRP